MAAAGTVVVTNDKAAFTTRCMFCGNFATLSDLDPGKLALFLNGVGPAVQEMFPELDDDQREILISGTHATCWESLRDPDEDE